MFQLTVNDQQIRLLINALDVYSRIGIVQLEIVTEILIDLDQLQPDQVDYARDKINLIKIAMGQSPHGSKGITHLEVSDDTKAAYDLLCVVRKGMADNVGDKHSTWSHEPMHVCKDVPLASIVNIGDPVN